MDHCECNLNGSLTKQCNENGKCECKTNITGKKCDRCANDNISFPNCTTTIATTSATRTGNFTTSSDIFKFLHLRSLVQLFKCWCLNWCHAFI